MHRPLIAGAVAILLAGCSSFSVPPSTGPASLRALDYASDDLAGVVFAFDLPEGVQPLIGGTALSVEATSAAGARRVRAVLQPADFGEVSMRSRRHRPAGPTTSSAFQSRTRRRSARRRPGRGPSLPARWE